MRESCFFAVRFDGSNVYVDQTGFEPATPEPHSGAVLRAVVEKRPNYEKKLQKCCKKSINFARISGMEVVSKDENINRHE